jgi:hypothetical protein
VRIVHGFVGRGLERLVVGRFERIVVGELRRLRFIGRVRELVVGR